MKKQIYKFLNKNSKTIKNISKKFGTEKQANDLTESLLDEKNFLPNTLTLSRIPMIPVIYASILTANPIIIGSLITLTAATDALDGLAARHITKNPNPGGALLDCVTDKIFSMALIIPAVIINPILIINASLEGIIALVNKKATKKGSEQKSTHLGKIKMWPLSLITALTYINIPLNSPLITTIITSGAILTSTLEITNIFEYKKQEKNYLKNKTSNNRKKEEEKIIKEEKILSRRQKIEELKELKKSLQEEQKPQKEKIKIYKKM